RRMATTRARVLQRVVGRWNRTGVGGPDAVRPNPMTVEQTREALLDTRVPFPNLSKLRDRVANDQDLLPLLSVVSATHRDKNEMFRMMLQAFWYIAATRFEPAQLAAMKKAFSALPLTDEHYHHMKRTLLESRPLVASLLNRRKQVNNPLRSAALFPAFCAAAELAGRRPLGLIEIGAAMGLNLCWDGYHYHYEGHDECGDTGSPCRLSYTLRTSRSAQLPSMSPTPQVSTRIGLELHPVDIHDPNEMMWMR